MTHDDRAAERVWRVGVAELAIAFVVVIAITALALAGWYPGA